MLQFRFELRCKDAMESKHDILQMFQEVSNLIHGNKSDYQCNRIKISPTPSLTDLSFIKRWRIFPHRPKITLSGPIFNGLPRLFAGCPTFYDEISSQQDQGNTKPLTDIQSHIHLFGHLGILHEF